MLGIAQIALGKREDAYRNLNELEKLLTKLPTGSLSTGPILTFMSLIAIAMDDQERVKKLYASLLPFSGQYYGFLVDSVLGEMATLRGDWEIAKLHLSTAKEIAQREKLLPELARILVKQADLEMKYGVQGSDVSVKDTLNHSLVLFEELDMIDSSNRVNHRLRSLIHRIDNSSLQSLPADLTRREAKVLQLVVDGKSNRQIAYELGISEKTVANHLSHIFNKTMSDNRAAAAAFAIRHGLA
jgi:DNA-binding CsgD family transcriptional regulator